MKLAVVWNDLVHLQRSTDSNITVSTLTEVWSIVNVLACRRVLPCGRCEWFWAGHRKNLTGQTSNEDRKHKGWDGWQKQKVKLKIERGRVRDIAKTWDARWTTVHLLLLCVCVCVPPCNIKADACCIPHDLFRLQSTLTLFRLCNLHFQVCSPV
jgi:hypothetical protein